MTKKNLVVTVVPNWNLKEDLGECLQSLQRQTYTNHLIVVVDNGSTDGSSEFVQTHYPDVQLIPLPKNQGYAAALNVGIRYALIQHADYVFALNNDTVLELNTLERLVQVLDSNIQIGIVSPKILYFDHPERIYRLGDRSYKLLPIPLGFGNKWRDHPKYSRLLEFDYVSGCAMLIRATIFKDIGMFDTSFFMYYEDGDFCRRTRDHGYRIVCAGNAVLYHKASLSSKKIQGFITQVRARNRVRFYRRHRHGPHPLLTYAIISLVDFWRLAEYLLKGQTLQVKPFVQGILQGWREPLQPQNEDQVERGSYSER